jgi:hypothetical protein
LHALQIDGYVKFQKLSPQPIPPDLPSSFQSHPQPSILHVLTKRTGSAAFTGLGIYSYASGMSQLKEREAEILRSGSRVTMQARRLGIFGLSGVLVGLGVYRLVN